MSIDPKRLGFTALALLIGLGCAEGLSAIGLVLYRSAQPVQPDPVLHHAFRASYRHIDHQRANDYLLQTNRQRWPEAADVEPHKPAGTFRIFYVGDSNTLGPLEARDKMVEIVGVELNRRSPADIHFEVINTGTTSYSFLQYMLIVKTQLVNYAPDLVVFNIDMTDLANHYFYRQFVERDAVGDVTGIHPTKPRTYRQGPKGYTVRRLHPALYRALVDHSAVFDLADYVVSRTVLDDGVATYEAHETSSWLDREWSPETEREVWNAFDILTEAFVILRSRGVKIMLTGVPHYPQFSGEWSARPHAELRRLAEKEGVPFLDSYRALETAVRGTPVERYYWATDPTHLNRAGNRLWADAQLAFLLEPLNHLLPALSTSGRP